MARATGQVNLAVHDLLERGMRQLEYLMPSSLPRTFPLCNSTNFSSALSVVSLSTLCTLTVTPSSPFYPNDSPITPHLHPQTHAHLLRTIQPSTETSPRKGSFALAGVMAHSFTMALRAALDVHAIDLPAADDLTI